MASCLYECLCEAHLEKYYPNFTEQGFQRIDELARIALKDYSKLGVRNMKDRKRLFQLVRIVKMLQAEEEEAEMKKQPLSQTDAAASFPPPVTRSGPRRQLHFDSLEEEIGGGRSPEPGLCTLSSSVNKEKGDLAVVLSHGTEYKRPRKDGSSSSAIWTEHQVGSGSLSLNSCNDIAPLLMFSEAPYIQRVAHISGYNYGVPRSCTRLNAPEQETPWTETERIRVCVRKRPLGLREERRGEVNVITVDEEDTLLLHEKKEAVDLTQYILQHVFYFDEVFGEACSNQDVYMKTAHPLIQHIFNGGNATCFAYGQTGAGKTYTMIGTHQNPGLYALAAKDIFGQLEASQTRKDLHVWISFYEIYCGQLYDLLNGRKRLFAREDSKHVVQIVGLRESQVKSVNLLLEVILKGGKERSTGATGVNSDSSRSHAIIQIQIKDSANRVFGRISFIDLAGSERAADARDSDRQTKMEGAEINQSLLALKECIRALDQEHAHTPFRQSKLTQVLKDSFVGNSKTCMIANVSPSHVATEHTLNTLRYADRVKELKRGMKWCTPVASRQRATGNASPKRIQSSPSAPAGGKSSPKKVKLGLQPPAAPSAPSKTKGPPGLFHPVLPAFSPTPKGPARRGPLGAPWVGQSSPAKGALRAGGPSRRTSEGPTAPSMQKHDGRKGSPAGREGGPGDRQPVKAWKVQPVQKQLVSRANFPFAGPVAPLEDGERLFAEQGPAAVWASPPSHQKEREQHLRLYHQQFQKPPILQQKLHYQPLEKLLAQYKTQGVQVKEEPPCPASPPDGDETMQLEELDDSDFSEDSFSLGSSWRKAELEAKRGGNQGSFFLHHQREHRAECWEVQGGQELFSKQYGLESKEASASPRVVEGEANSREGGKSQSEWSVEDLTTTSGSSPKNDMPEKPYCSQEDLVTRDGQSPKEPLAGQKQQGGPGGLLGSPSDERFSVPEKAAQSPRLANTLGPVSCVAFGLAEGPLQDDPTPLPESARNMCHPHGTDSGGALKPPAGFEAVEMSPLTASFLNAGMTEEDPPLQWQEKTLLPEEGEKSKGKKLLQPRKGWEEEEEEESHHPRGSQTSSPSSLSYTGPCRRKPGQDLSPETKTGWLSESCHFPKISSPFGPALSELSGCVLGYSGGDAAGRANVLSLCAETERTLFLSRFVTSPPYDAEAEVREMGPLDSSPPFSLGEDVGPKAVGQLGHLDAEGKSFLSSPSSLPDCTGSQTSSAGSISLQPSLAFTTLDVGPSREGSELTSCDEEMGLLKDKPTEIVLAHTPDLAKQSPEAVVTKGPNPRIPKGSPNGYRLPYLPESPLPYQEALGRQIVLQIHRKQLDDLASLCLQEESLIYQMPELECEDFVAKLDRILALKSKCIQVTRTQLKPFFTAPSGEVAMDGDRARRRLLASTE